MYANAAVAPLALAALLATSIGQSLAVPRLGFLAPAEVPEPAQGAAAGLFFAWFDAGAGLGGPAVGAVAALTGCPSGALEAAAAAVGGAVLLAGVVLKPRAGVSEPAPGLGLRNRA